MKKATTIRNEIDYWNAFLRKIQEAGELAGLEDESLYGDLENELNSIEPR